MVDEIKSWVKKDLIIKEGYNQLQEILLDRAIDLTRNKTAKEIFKDIDTLISKINTYKSDIDTLVTIGRQNALNDLDNELIKIKKKSGIVV